MKIYKVCANFQKGIQEFEILKINEDGKFTYEKQWIGNRVLIKSREFNAEHPNDSSFFRTKDEAKGFIIEKLKSSIEKHQRLITKSLALLNEL